MENKDINLLDDKFEVAGGWPTNQPLTHPKPHSKLYRYFGAAAAVAAVATGIFIWIKSSQTPQIENGVFDPLPTKTARPMLNPNEYASGNSRNCSRSSEIAV